jgi:hypothetical protein
MRCRISTPVSGLRSGSILDPRSSRQGGFLLSQTEGHARIVAHQGIDQIQSLLKFQPTLLDEFPQGKGDAATSEAGMANHGFDGDVIAAESEQLVGWHGQDGLLQEILRGDWIDDPSPAQVDVSIRVMLGHGQQILVIRVGNVHEDEASLWRRTT